MSRRHESLIPLSHQHQHALALAVIIKRRFGAEKGEQAWRTDATTRILHLYKTELIGHFEAEEDILFPEMERYLGRLELISELRQEHQALHELVHRLEGFEDTPIETLDEFSNSIERHVRKEERRLFAEFEKRMPATEASRVGREIDARLLRACPKL